MWVIKQTRGKRTEYFSGFRRSYYFLSLTEACNTDSPECGIIVYNKESKAKSDFKRLQHGGSTTMEIVAFDLP